MCTHSRIQQFTEVCLDCGANVYETDEERVKRLREEVSSLKREVLKKQADSLEAERNRLLAALGDEQEPDTGW
jgi:hypothetical protein